MNLLKHLIKQFIIKLITLGYKENDIFNEMENYCNDPEEEVKPKGKEVRNVESPIMCHKCNIEMKEGDALQNTSVMGIPDFEGQDNSGGQTFHYGGTGKLIKVYKCPDCGHSISRGASEYYDKI